MITYVFVSLFVSLFQVRRFSSNGPIRLRLCLRDGFNPFDICICMDGGRVCNTCTQAHMHGQSLSHYRYAYLFICVCLRLPLECLKFCFKWQLFLNCRKWCCKCFSKPFGRCTGASTCLPPLSLSMSMFVRALSGVIKKMHLGLQKIHRLKQPQLWPQWVKHLLLSCVCGAEMCTSRHIYTNTLKGMHTYLCVTSRIAHRSHE